MKRKLLVCVLAAAMLVTMLAGCGTSGTNDTKKTAAVKDKVTFAMYADLGIMDPNNNGSVSDQVMYANIYNALVFRTVKGEFTPDLAESWTVSDDGKTYTFKLKKGVKFHNGEEMKAKDVVYTYNLAKKSAALASFAEPIKEAVAVDDYTVNIILNTTYAPALLSFVQIAILNEKAYTEAKGNYGKDNAVGTGPYKFVKHDVGQSVVLTRFDDYFKAKPAIKDIEYKIITDENSTFIAVQSGDVDFAFKVPNVSLTSAKNDKNLAIHEYQGLGMVNIIMNNAKKPFNDLKVRQALNCAIDKDSVIQMVFEGNGKKADTAINDCTFGYSADVKGYEYNPEKAKQLLTEAGYPNGLKITLKTIDGTLKKVAEVLQENLGKIGVTVDIQSCEKNALITDLVKGDFEISDMTITMTPDLDSWQLVLGSKGGFNLYHYSSAKVDGLFAKGQTTLDNAQRLEAYKELLQTITDDAVMVPVCFPVNAYVANKGLKMGDIDGAGTFYVADMSWEK